MTKLDIVYNVAKSGNLSTEKYASGVYFCSGLMCSLCPNDKNDCDSAFKNNKNNVMILRAISYEELEEFYGLYPEYKIIS